LPATFGTIEDYRNPVMGAFKDGERDIVGSRPSQIRKGKTRYLYQYFYVFNF